MFSSPSTETLNQVGSSEYRSRTGRYAWRTASPSLTHSLPLFSRFSFYFFLSLAHSRCRFTRHHTKLMILLYINSHLRYPLAFIGQLNRKLTKPSSPHFGSIGAQLNSKLSLILPSDCHTPALDRLGLHHSDWDALLSPFPSSLRDKPSNVRTVQTTILFQNLWCLPCHYLSSTTLSVCPPNFDNPFFRSSIFSRRWLFEIVFIILLAFTTMR